MLPLVVGSIARLFRLLVLQDSEIVAEVIGRSSCPGSHQVGKITVRHDTVIECHVAEEVAEMARLVWWWWVVPEFRKYERWLNPTKEPDLMLIFKEKERGGWAHTNKITINLAGGPERGEVDCIEFPLSILASVAGGPIKGKVNRIRPFLSLLTNLTADGPAGEAVDYIKSLLDLLTDLADGPAGEAANYIKFLLSSLAHELYHLAERRIWGDDRHGEYVIKAKEIRTREDRVRYYALHPWEYRALRFEVAHVDRYAELLEEVKEYRALHNIT